MIFNSPVYPIPPSFDKEALDLNYTEKYLKFLHKEGCKTIMSTAGTSQFNLMNLEEIRKFNELLLSFNGKKIIGIPPLATLHLKKEIEFYNTFKDIYLLILFPERYYNNEQVVNFFKDICYFSSNPIIAHGNLIKRGNEGSYEYEYNLLSELSKIESFVGIKEESSNLNFAMNNIQNLNLEIIVAGGSMRRFWSLEPFGATTYIAGVGSFNPKVEETFFKLYKEGKLKDAKSIIEEVETPLFNTFMKIGWHCSMRESLKHMGFIKENRKPFITPTLIEQNKIKEKLNRLIN